MTDGPDRLYEQLLVLRCQTGDEAAFAELVARYGPRLHYYLRKMLADPGQADDALQEVWFDAFRGLGGLTEPAALSTWLYRIARGRAARVFRNGRPAPRPLADDDATHDPADVDFTAEDAARIHAALDRLAPDHRE